MKEAAVIVVETVVRRSSREPMQWMKDREGIIVD